MRQESVKAFMFRTAWPGHLLVVIGFALLLLLAGWWTYLQAPACGLHFIRQTDSLAFATNYFHQHGGLFSPETWMYFGPSSRAACEFPLFYYIAGKCAYSEAGVLWVLRSMSFAALIAAFSAVLLELRSSSSLVVSTALALLLFSSSTLLTYAAMPLPDGLACSFTVMALALGRRKPETGTIEILLFSAAALLKPTYGIYPLALCLYSLVSNPSLRNTRAFKPLLSLILPAAWYFYALAYNTQNESGYFMLHTASIWTLTSAEIHEVWKYVDEYWQNAYYYPTTFHLLLAGPLLLCFKGFRQKEFFLVLFSALGALCYALLFYQKFKDHDYYALVFFPLVVLWVLYLVQCAKHLEVSKRWIRPAFAVGCVFMAVLSLKFGMYKCAERFDTERYTSQEASRKSLNDAVVAQLRANIKPDETVAVIGDEAPNGSLGMICRKGWAYPTWAAFDGAQAAEMYTPTYLLVLGTEVDAAPAHYELLDSVNEQLHLFRIYSE